MGCPGSRRYAPAFRGKPAVARVDCLNSPRRYICIRCNASYYALTRCTVTDMACRPPGPKASHCLWEPDLVLNGLKRALSFEHCAPLGPPVRRRTACCNTGQHVATQYNMLRRSTTSVHACLSPVHHPHVAPAEGGESLERSIAPVGDCCIVRHVWVVVASQADC